MSKQPSREEIPIIIPGSARDGLAKALRDLLNPSGEQRSDLKYPPRVEIQQKEKKQKAAKRTERAQRLLLGVFACFALIAACIYLLFLQPPQCTSLQNVPGSSIYLFTCYPRVLGAGDEGRLKITVINDGSSKLADVKVYLVCPRQLQVGVDVNGSNMIQFDDLEDGVRKTGEVKLSPGEISSIVEEAPFSLKVTGAYTVQVGSVISDAVVISDTARSVISGTVEGGTFSMFPFSVDNALKGFWASASASVVSLFSVIATPIWVWLTKRKTG